MPIIHITAIIQRLIRYTEVIAKTEIHESMPLSDVSDSNFLLINTTVYVIIIPFLQPDPIKRVNKSVQKIE